MGDYNPEDAEVQPVGCKYIFNTWKVLRGADGQSPVMQHISVLHFTKVYCHLSMF